MDYRLLGSTGVRVSELCLGTWMFGTITPEDEAIRMLHLARDKGVNFLDTAESYGKGASEEVIGRAIHGYRDEVVVATKVSGAAWRTMRQACERSLRRLQTDYIDLYQLHWPQWAVPLEETLAAFDRLVRQGKVLYAGCSNLPAWAMCKLLWLADRHGGPRLACAQPHYNLLVRHAEQAELPFCHAERIGVITWSPLEMGLLAGKYRHAVPQPGDRWERRPFEQITADAQVQAVLAKLYEIADALGRPPAHVALAWQQSRPMVTAPIVGARTLDQLESNLGAIGLRLEADHLRQLDEVSAPFIWREPSNARAMYGLEILERMSGR